MDESGLVRNALEYPTAWLRRTTGPTPASLVYIVEDGEIAVRKVLGTSYDTMLRGMQIPRHAANHRHQPNAFERNRQECLNVGMNDFLAKPFEKDQLDSAVMRCFD